MRKFKEKRGITLIALVITIIVLLILAGVSLSLVMGNDGILGKATSASQKTKETEIRERIEMLLFEYQVEKAENTSLTLLIFFEEKKKEGKIDKVEEDETGKVYVTLNDYTATIDAEKQNIINFEISNEIRFLYELISKENNKFKILIKVSEQSSGIASIQFPTGESQNYNGQKEVEIEYELDEGVDYTFIIQNTTGAQKEEKVNLSNPAQPTITTSSINYPVLTLSGVKEPKITIEYDTGKDFLNYYSLDEGQTWNLYTGPISIASNIMAKSQHKMCPEIMTETNLTLDELPKIIGPEAYDGDESTSYTLDLYNKGGNSYIEIDSQVIGQELEIHLSNVYYSVNGGGASVNFVNENFEVVKTIVSLPNGGGSFEDKHVQVPEEVKYLGITISGYGGPVTIYEIKAIDRGEKLLPKMTSESQDDITLSASDYFQSSGKIYYACDTDRDTAWGPDSGNYDPHYFKVEFNTPKVVTSYYLRGAYCFGVPTKFYIQASNDDSNWVNLEGDTVHEGSTTGPVEYTVDLENSTAYRYYRFYFPVGGWTWGSSGGAFIYDLQLYSKS